MGPKPAHDVVVMAVRKAASPAVVTARVVTLAMSRAAAELHTGTDPIV